MSEQESVAVCADTLLLLPDGTETSVGCLALDNVKNPQETWPMRTEPYVFVSHAGLDKDGGANRGVKEAIARPTHWFLTEVLEVNAFLDDDSIRWGRPKMEELIAPAHQCTHALVICSPAYRMREYCIRELNTFMRRWINENGIRVLPALFEIESLDGYHDEVRNLTWRRYGGGSVDFMVKGLWPQLAEEFGAKQNIDYEASLFEYIEDKRGENNSIPLELEIFAKRYEKFAKRKRLILCLAVFVLMLLLGAAVAAVLVVGENAATRPGSPVPTASPTATPTLRPTASPTATPTLRPTATATAIPTLRPTASPTATPTVNPTASPTATPTVRPTVSPTCTDCRRIVLTHVKTAGDGAGGPVEPQFSINGIQVFPLGQNGCFGKLPQSQQKYELKRPYPQLGNIRPTDTLVFDILEEDDSFPVDFSDVFGDAFGDFDPDLDPDDNASISIEPTEWYRAGERSPYDKETPVFENWKFWYTVETHCCD